MYILLGPLAFTLGTVSYHSWLRYSMARLPKYGCPSKHDHPSEQCQILKLGRVPDASATFVEEHPLLFMCLAVAIAVFGICIVTASAVLTFIRGGHWATAFGTTPTLLSMIIECLWLRSSRNPQQDAFSTLLLWVLLGTACSLTLGAILSIWVAPETIFVVVLSASAYRGWLVWEWGTIVRDTMEKPRLLLCMMMQVAVLGITCVAFGIRLAEPGLASTYTEMLIISYGFVLLDLAMLSISTFRLRRRYASAAKETRAAFAAFNSTSSLAEGSVRHRAQNGDERIPQTNSNAWAHGQNQTTIREESLGMELKVRDVV
ncbi:hypothetical protein MRS44_017820 [Fusarium solani]|uniref:uncharacterized protein n=1 Tax=Fusarium solani TaxID=169388 RepID=UPI0032C42FE7|nr:hypothetical protein MRS44_017820 [Fusarium solani]